MDIMLHFVFVAINPRIASRADAERDHAEELQPLTPRSIVLSVLLGSHPPEMPVRSLVDFTSLFGIADGTTRTALSRMVASGELEADDGRYRLGPRLLRRQAEQDAGRAAPPADWDGSWWFVVVTADRRPLAERRRFRDRMIGARLGELRPDTWMRPANVDIPTDLPGAIVARGDVVDGDELDVTAALWDLDGLDRRTAALLADLDHVDALLAAHADTAPEASGTPSGRGDHLAVAFVRLAACQRFLRTEPQLPEELHRSDGAALRQRYGHTVHRYQSQLARFLRSRRAPG
jgi:phenylacetic acid degradation operon negative regulatory protein